jgi:hypothetical protein
VRRRTLSASRSHPGGGSACRTRGKPYVPPMRTILLLLGAAGVAAVALRAAGALMTVISGGVESFLARDVADVRARRGDLTGLADADAVRQRARRRRFVALGVFSMWVCLLIVPPLTPWPGFLYAAYSLLWLVPRRTRPDLHAS